VLAGCGGGDSHGDQKPTTDQVRSNQDRTPTREQRLGASLTVAHGIARDTVRVGQILGHSPVGGARDGRVLTVAIENLGYSALLVTTLEPEGLVGRQGVVLERHLGSYEAGIRSVLKLARAGKSTPRAILEEVREAGAEVRRLDVDWQSTLRAARDS
jgi:hypothetical protein